jgi:hypothetical protein
LEKNLLIGEIFLLKKMLGHNDTMNRKMWFFSPNFPCKANGYDVLMVVCKGGIFLFGSVIPIGHAKLVSFRNG